MSSDVATDLSTNSNPKSLSPGLSKEQSLSNVQGVDLPEQLYTGKYIRSAFSGAEKRLKIKLAAMEHESPGSTYDPELIAAANDKKTLNRAYFKEGSPVNKRVNDAIVRLAAQTSFAGKVKIELPGPGKTLILDEPGMAYLAALPEKEDPKEGRVFKNEYVSSYELANDQGVIHKPLRDRRTSGKETFHIADYGYPVPYDKTPVPAEAAIKILQAALNPPEEDMILPYTKDWGDNVAKTFVSLMVNPPVVPGVDGFTQTEYMETMVLAPGGCVSNLDFIERIFGNAGDQYDPANNLALNPECWTGDTGAIIFAPHLTKVSLEKMGIDPSTLNIDNPNIKFYNDGNAFLLKIRDPEGVVITIIGDNYFGLGKKTIMTDASFVADRRGLVMQEHAGGAFVFPQVDLGSYFSVATHAKDCPPFSHTVEILGNRLEMLENGSAVDRFDKNIVYLPESASFVFNRKEQKLRWSHNGIEYSENINPSAVYFLPNGMSISLLEEPGLGNRTEAKLIGCYARGTFIHKSDSVSGAGKSEIAKAVEDLVIYRPLGVSNLKAAFEGLEAILHGHWPPKNHYQTRFKEIGFTEGRPAVDQRRSFGSLEKLLTESPEYTDEYNKWLRSIPMVSKLMAFHLHMAQSSGQDISNWKDRFKVSKIDGQEGHHIYFDGELMKVRYLRLGTDQDSEQRLSTIRPDVAFSKVLKEEDDLTVSVCVPSRLVDGAKQDWGICKRFVKNMERRFFNRTDGTFERGAEDKAECDISGKGNYLVNFEPLPLSFAKELIENVIEFRRYTKEQQKNIEAAYKAHQEGKVGYFCASDFASIIGHKADGTPIRSPNPRYMEDEDKLVSKKPFMLAEIATRLYRNVDTSKEIYFPVDVNNPARRLNTTDYTANGSLVPHIAVYPPVIMQELPELMMDLISSVTGKSPSTTGGLGSEGAGTKGPFNCMQAVHYLNSQIRAMALTEEPVVTTAAAMIGANYNIGHDLSIAVKEVLARVDPAELKLEKMIANGYMEPDPDVSYEDQTVKGGNFYRLTRLGCTRIFGHLLLNADKAFTDEQLKPELQDKKLYVEGMAELQRQHRSIALKYFQDGSIEYASPPLKALLNIMAFGEYRFDRTNPETGVEESVRLTRDSAEFREMFKPENILKSDWYPETLREAQAKDIKRLNSQKEWLSSYVEAHSDDESFTAKALRVYKDRLIRMEKRIEEVQRPEYLEKLYGSIGAEILAA